MPRYKRVSKWLDNGNRDLVLGPARALYAAEVTMTDRCSASSSSACMSSASSATP